MMSGPHYLARLLSLNSLAALQNEMRRLDVDKGGIPIMSAKGVQRLILLEQIPTAAANIIKQEALARGGDLVTPSAASGFETPYVDAVLIGNLTTLRSTISKLYRQHAYDLPLIADAIQQVVVRTTPGYLPVSPRPSRQGVVVEETLEDLTGGRIPLQPGSNRAVGRPTLVAVPGHTWRFGERTYIMGTVNATPDSWQRIQQAVREGAHIVEICGDSAVPLIERTRVAYPDLIIAVGTSRARVAEAAAAAGAQIIDDWGQGEPDLARVAAETGLPILLTHSRPALAYRDLVSDVARLFRQAMDAAMRAGVREEQIILDAGIGFAKTAEQDLELTRRLREFTSFGRPLLFAPSRMNAAGLAPGLPGTMAEPLPVTMAAVSFAIAAGADIVRVHDVLDIARCVEMTDSLVRGHAGPDE